MFPYSPFLLLLIIIYIAVFFIVLHYLMMWQKWGPSYRKGNFPIHWFFLKKWWIRQLSSALLITLFPTRTHSSNIMQKDSPFMVVLGHFVRAIRWNRLWKEEGFKAAYVFFFFINRVYVCVRSSKAKDEFKRKTFPRSQCQGRIFLSLVCVYVCM